MTITIYDVAYSFKTSFSEYTFGEYVPVMEARGKPLIERINAYTSIPVDVLDKLPLEYLNSLIELVKFNEDEELLIALSEPTGYVQDVGFYSYGHFETVKQKIKGKSSAGCMADIVHVYTGMQIDGMPLTYIYNTAVHFIASLNKFFERYSRLNDHKYTDEEIEAGVENLEGFGFFGTVIKIGRERSLTNEQVLSLPAIEIMDEVLYDFERSEYEKRYNKLLQDRQEHFNKLKP